MKNASLIGTRPTGTIYGVVLNDRRTQERLCDEFDQPPYKSPPVAPVMYIKTSNTVVGDGAAVRIPQEPGVVRIDATVGAVIGQSATAIKAEDAIDHVAG